MQRYFTYEGCAWEPFDYSCSGIFVGEGSNLAANVTLFQLIRDGEPVMYTDDQEQLVVGKVVAHLKLESEKSDEREIYREFNIGQEKGSQEEGRQEKGG